MVEHLVVTLKVVSSNLGKGKPFFIIENKVTESMTMVAPSGVQIKSLKSYKNKTIWSVSMMKVNLFSQSESSSKEPPFLSSRKENAVNKKIEGELRKWKAFSKL